MIVGQWTDARERSAKGAQTQRLLDKKLVSGCVSLSLLPLFMVSTPVHAQGTAAPGTAACSAIKDLHFPDATITLVEARPAGEFETPGPAMFPGANKMQVAAFCRVAVTLKPSADSDIKMELWLPDNWNGKFMMVGNGAWSGAVSYSAMGGPLKMGYAVASTDTGHEGGRGIFALGHPEKLVDFAWRAVHETVVKSKAVVTRYYGGGPKLSYWNGCSSGGKQGLKEVQKFPNDFDGVIAGAPANNWINLQVQSMVASMANRGQDGKPILGMPQFNLLHKGVILACDGLDGLRDGEIADPRQCKFSAKSLICKPGQDAASCLTPQMAEAADKIYAPVRDPKTRALIYPGMPPGSEMLWMAVAMQPWMVGVDTFAVLLDKPDWAQASLDLSRDIPLAAKADPGIVATDPDLSAFKAHGGKLIQYHGWADALIPTENSINYYESVIARQGSLKATQDFHRLFLVPAMGHCSGAYDVDWIKALEGWVEGGKAPDSVPARRLPAMSFPPAPATAAPQDLGSRPICAYPAIARYKGKGAGDDPAEFSCVAAPRGARTGHKP